MRKKLYLFPLFLLGFFMFTTTSCLNSNNDNDVEIDEEWKALNETRFAKVASDDSFNALLSQSGNGKVYWQPSTVITDGNSVRMTVEGRPEFTDTVVARYEGWYFDRDNKKIIFDSTENPSLISQINYTYGLSSSVQPNYTRSQFTVNKVIDGWITLLQDMKVGDERVVCIPQELGYGSVDNTYTPNVTGASTFKIIPAYTTLWFRIKLYEIIPMKPLKD
ncbi:FKBP-type peptidyl-prolyl cis-trans isomerase [Dysgonomonas sp. HGC4]|uniref:FKBP-type peptidyl-prolyl cis-trans isomerase n=1 Tax=Dysgonomonas sp. HGC4 TaxID=1658009 RepID=UPI00068000F4|nr:FKBP-type peptidyl-prolyl cis-trans isomerase [Dysgonomonas sp. HGC4]MBD8349229.1 FKBP-type peptidyl-prolyl cis-trans isomerase [Dysgonomonas sp. HGC4]